jgi:hypothetical protein
MPLNVSASIAWGLGLLISSTPCQRDRYIGNIDRHWRLRLVHGDLDALDGLIAQARQRNSVGKGFNQIQWVSFNVCSDRPRESTVVDGLRNIVSARRWRKIHSAAHVDDESLTPVTLEVEYAMVAIRGYPSQADPIAATLGGTALCVYDCVCRHATS